MEELREGFLASVRAVYAPADSERVERALAAAEARLAGAKRASGEPAAAHDLRVAAILVELGLDADSVVAGLLHDALDPVPGAPEGSEAERAAKTVAGAAAAAAARAEDRRRLEAGFGPVAASLVEGVSRLAALRAKNKTVQAAETMRKMLFAMTRDIRVILVKLADKLDNMRTLKFLPEERQKEIAAECLDIFAPLADRLGVSWMKDELEDLSLKALNREAFDQIKGLVSAKKGEREVYLERVERAIREAAGAEGVEVEISARAKHFYSIYQKMRKKAKGAEELYDLLGVRLITESDNDCYALLGLVHRIWKPIEGRFKDYIAMPKANGYRSLHTTVMGFDGRLLEVQIRTREMHRIAEYGVASHWLYKKGSTAEAPKPEDLPIVNRLKEWGDFLSQGAEYLEEIKRELLKDSIFVFTPQGDVVELPAGAGPLDFAFAIHTDVGTKCMGAKADGQIVPLDGELRNTQVVEILTSPQAHPTMNWLPLAKTSKARQKIRAWLVQSGQVLAIERNIVAGRHTGSAAEARAREAARELKEAGAGHEAAEAKAREAREAREAAKPRGPVENLGETTVYRRVTPGEALRNEKAGVAIGGQKNLMIRIAGCCRPVTGDAIVGYVSRGRGIIVHRADCKSLAAVPDFQERRIEVSWESTASLVTARFRIVARRSPDLFAEIESAMHKFQGHLREGRLGERGDAVSCIRQKVRYDAGHESAGEYHRVQGEGDCPVAAGNAG
ncbi:MAG TPA: RelA/SpoT family protein, partial [Spirochaetales bacterium]|nr:RelA/SpoT family protein [Spirochaetales bacterium]